jgi:23S rRNA (pseudouridine1915-N3)-methyltransferase
LGTGEFTVLLSRYAAQGIPDLAFLIGGADGHPPAVKSAAAMLLSLGPMTWPHRLVRVMLAEQIYRAVTIMVNHPYHRP